MAAACDALQTAPAEAEVFPRWQKRPLVTGHHKDMAAAALTAAARAELLASINVFLFDCDGVIWQGDTIIPGAPAAIAYLRSIGKRIYFVTNNSTKSRQVYVAKFKRLGIQASADEILGSAFAAALLLKDHPCLEQVRAQPWSFSDRRLNPADCCRDL